MTIVIQKEVWAILIVTAVLCAFMVYLGHALKKADPAKAPSGAANVALLMVNFIDGLIEENMGKRFVKELGPLVGTLGLYILVSNLVGLVGLPNPTGNYSVTLSLTLIAFVLMEFTAIRFNGIGGFLKGFTEPFILFLPMNIFSEFSPLLSMSLRLFGNILAGSLIMQVIYTGINLLSSLFPFIGQVNFLGPVIAPVFHAYFDVFAGCIQTYIFIMLTTALTANKAGD